jgi:transposase
MRAGADRLRARAVQVLGAARAHHACLFTNSRSTRVKLLMHDGFGVWCAVRRLNCGGFIGPRAPGLRSASLTLTGEPFDALILGLPWQRLEELKVISRM